MKTYSIEFDYGRQHQFKLIAEVIDAKVPKKEFTLFQKFPKSDWPIFKGTRAEFEAIKGVFEDVFIYMNSLDNALDDGWEATDK